MESLKYPKPEEFHEGNIDEMFKEAKDLPTEQIINILKGKEPANFLDPRDLKEVLLRRNVTFVEDTSYLPVLPFVAAATILSICAFFGWKLFKSLKDKQKKREEKKKLKQKKKK